MRIIGIVIIYSFPIVMGLLFGISYGLMIALHKDANEVMRKYRFYMYFFFLLPFFISIFLISLNTSIIKEIGLNLSYKPISAFIASISILIGMGLYYFELFTMALFDKITQSLHPLKTKLFVGNFKPSLKRKFSILIILSLFISFFEEFIWRGFLMTTLKNDFSLPLWKNIIFSSLLFGINHYYFGLRSIILKFLSGIIFAILYLSTNNIFAPFIAHASFNIYLWWRIKITNEKIQRIL